MSAPEDFILGTMLLLKNNWSLSGDLTGSNLAFTTGYYNEQLKTPQVCVTPLIEPVKVMNLGTLPFHFIQHIAQVNVWIKPPTGNNTSLGQAKNARYRILTEIRRIIREFATTIPNVQFARYNEVSYMEMLNVRPPLLNGELRATLYDFRGVEENKIIAYSSDFYFPDFVGGGLDFFTGSNYP
jgi:hypothetical protein